MAILGIDEVGRGPLAGPLVVGAVILPEVQPDFVDELRDSKKLSVKKREELAGVILEGALGTGLGWVSPLEIDEIGMGEALKLATRRAVEEVRESRAAFSQVIIDGKVNFLMGTTLEKYVSTVIKADDLIKEVSAASIIAKVARDKYMVELGVKFPGYGFERHMGYGTKAHFEAIAKMGVCPEHRKSFEPIKSMVGFERLKSVARNTTLIGQRGEDAVVEYLKKNGHTIVARNFKTYFYEIDIVSIFEGRIYFTEVKMRRSADFGGGLAAVDARKLKKMRFAAECFLKYHRKFDALDPLLAVAAVNGKFEVMDWFGVVG